MLAPGLPWSWGSVLLAASRGEPLKPGERLVPGHSGLGHAWRWSALDEQAVALPGLDAPAKHLTAFAADPAGGQQAAGDEADQPRRARRSTRRSACPSRCRPASSAR